MTSLVSDALAFRLAAAPGFRETGAVLAEVLAREWTADAIVVWRAARDGEAEDAEQLFVGGPALRHIPPRQLPCLNAPGVDRWLADQGLTARHVAGFPSASRGGIAAAWRRADAAPPRADDALAFVAAHVSLLDERRQFEQRLAAADAARIQAEDQLMRTRGLRSLGEMALGIVHDFNNCLTSIVGYTELALGPLEPGDAFYNDLSSIRMSALDAAALVRRLRSLGRKARESDEREVVDLQELAQVVPTLARPRWMQQADRHGVSFEVVVDARPVPPVHVVVAEIRELLLNLLFNAIDAMPAGGRITIATRQAEDGAAVISVADEGTGMPDDVTRQIFQPFFSTKGELGSGLGLSVCQMIAKRHGARLAVQSAPGQGTIFTLTVPPAARGMVSVPLTERIVEHPVTQQRILFVDDQPEVRDSVGEMLRAMGHRVTAAGSGEVAVALIGRQQIDAVITDLGMPGMSGLELAQRFRVLAPHVPVVLLTGWGLDADAARPENVVFALNKPVTMHALNEALAACGAEPTSDEWRTKCS